MPRPRPRSGPRRDHGARWRRTTLREHYERIAKEGQDYDPYTTLFAKGRTDIKRE